MSSNKRVALFIRSLLEAFGSLWLVTELVSFFSEKASAGIKSYWVLFLLCGVVLASYRLWPKKVFTYKIVNRDVCLEIVIGDILKQKGSLVVGSNTSFATSANDISPKSIQGIYTKKYFPSGTQALDAQIRQAYPQVPVAIGSTVAIQHDGHRAYLCAIASLGQNGVAKSSVEELREALASLWTFIGNSGEKDTLNIPVLGSGFSRIKLSREELVKEIVKSFVAATSEVTFCDGLRVVIHPLDVERYSIDIGELVQFVEYTCKYAIGARPAQGGGSPEA